MKGAGGKKESGEEGSEVSFLMCGGCSRGESE